MQKPERRKRRPKTDFLQKSLKIESKMGSDLDHEFSPNSPPRGLCSDLGSKGGKKEPKDAKRVPKDTQRLQKEAKIRRPSVERLLELPERGKVYLPPYPPSCWTPRRPDGQKPRKIRRNRRNMRFARVFPHAPPPFGSAFRFFLVFYDVFAPWPFKNTMF